MKKLLLSLAFICNGIFTNAQWQQTTLNTHEIYSFAKIGANIFAGTSVGVFITNNNGSTWTQVNTGMLNIDVKSLYVNGTSLYAGTTTGGAFLSTNNGTAWTDISLASVYTNITAFAAKGNKIFAGTYGLYVSTNNGGSWTLSLNGLPSDAITALLVSGSNIFAGTLQNGVYISTNDGTSWTAVNSGLTSHDISSLTINGNCIFAGTKSGGIFKSTNNGSSWTAVNNGISDMDIESLTVSGTSICAGGLRKVYYSFDLGANWTENSTGLPNSYIHALIINNSTLFAATVGYGVWKMAMTGLGIDEQMENISIAVFPNPASANITIETQQKSSIEIYNTLGEIVYQDSRLTFPDSRLIDISGFAKGMYFVKVKNENGIAVKKFIKE